jgi:hypothetical protein
MRCRIKRLRDKGVRLKESAIDESFVGELRLRVEESNRSGNPPRRIATLIDTHGTGQWDRNVVAPLFDPRILSIDGDTITLTGVELESVPEGVRETVQVWRCQILR